MAYFGPWITWKRDASSQYTSFATKVPGDCTVSRIGCFPDLIASVPVNSGRAEHVVVAPLFVKKNEGEFAHYIDALKNKGRSTMIVSIKNRLLTDRDMCKRPKHVNEGNLLYLSDDEKKLHQTSILTASDAL